STDARAVERTRREARASGGKKAACRLPPRRPRASSETVPHAEVHVVVDLTVDLEVEFEYPVSDEDVRRFAEARFERNRDVLDVVGVTERDDVRRVERGQRDRRGAVAAQVVAQSPAESDREHVLVLDGHQCAVSARADLEGPVRPPVGLADVEQYVRYADQIAFLVQEYADAYLVSAELADVHIASVHHLHRI